MGRCFCTNCSVKYIIELFPYCYWVILVVRCLTCQWETLRVVLASPHTDLIRSMLFATVEALVIVCIGSRLSDETGSVIKYQLTLSWVCVCLCSRLISRPQHAFYCQTFSFMQHAPCSAVQRSAALFCFPSVFWVRFFFFVCFVFVQFRSLLLPRFQTTTSILAIKINKYDKPQKRGDCVHLME